MQPVSDPSGPNPGAAEVTPKFAGVRALVLMTATVLLIEWLDLDRAIAHAGFYGDARGWLGGGTGSGWARGIIHSGGRALVQGIAAAALCCWLLSHVLPRLRPWRREALFIFAGMILVSGAAGLLKLITNVDCPWDVAGFGGGHPYVPLFGDRPDYLPRAQCFPGAHSASGFALLSLYFALRGRCPRLARGLAVFAIGVGVVFAFGQEARGAHFLSHDLASAALAWGILQAMSAQLTARSWPANTRSFRWRGNRECSARNTATQPKPSPR